MNLQHNIGSENEILKLEQIQKIRIAIIYTHRFIANRTVMASKSMIKDVKTTYPKSVIIGTKNINFRLFLKINWLNLEISHKMSLVGHLDRSASKFFLQSIDMNWSKNYVAAIKGLVVLCTVSAVPASPGFQYSQQSLRIIPCVHCVQ